MIQVAVQGGRIVLREGKVGTSADCCCPCECPTECVEGLFISLSETPSCSSSEAGVVYQDSAVLENPCDPELALLASVQMQCVDGEWTAQLFLCGFGCLAQYEVELPMGDDCLPVAGEVTGWTPVSVTDDTCCGDALPTVTILR